MGAKGSVEAAKLNADNWGHLEVCMTYSVSFTFTGWSLDTESSHPPHSENELTCALLNYLRMHLRLTSFTFLSTLYLHLHPPTPALEVFVFFSVVHPFFQHLFVSALEFCFCFVMPEVALRCWKAFESDQANVGGNWKIMKPNPSINFCAYL